MSYTETQSKIIEATTGIPRERWADKLADVHKALQVTQEQLANKFSGRQFPFELRATPAASPLSIATYDGGNESVHPCPVYIPETFGGYSWWMALTPYTGGSSAVENPCIYYSLDGISWTGITGNPIEPAPGGGNHHADTCLIYDRAGSRLVCYYTYRDPGADYKVYAEESADGLTWSNKTALLDGDDVSISDASPTVVKHGDKWLLWSNNYLAAGANQLLLYEADDPMGPFTLKSACQLNGFQRDLWQMHITKIGDFFYGCFTCCDRNTSGANTLNVFGVSADGQTWTAHSEIFIDSGEVAWSNTPYTGKLVEEGPRLWLYYSGGTSGGAWQCGRTQISERKPDRARVRTANAYTAIADQAQLRLPFNGHSWDVSGRSVTPPASGITYVPFFNGLLGASFDGTAGLPAITKAGMATTTTDAFSLSFWYKKTATASGVGTSVIFGSVNGVGVFFDHASPAFRECLAFYSGTWNSSYKLDAGPDWNHYAIVFEASGGNVLIYKNAKLESTIARAALASIGEWSVVENTGAAEIATCALAEVMFFNGTISLDQISVLYLEALAGRT